MMRSLLASAIFVALQINPAFAQEEMDKTQDPAMTEEGVSSEAGVAVDAAGNETTSMEEAEAEPAGPLSTTITFVSDYRFRGVTQTLEDPALQADLKYTHDSGIYASLWASDVKFAAPANVAYEVDTAIGWAGSLTDDVGLDLQLVRYNYPVDQPESDYAEVVGKITYAGAFATVGYSNDVFNLNETGIYYGIGYGLTVADEYNVSASLGYYDLDDALDGSYTDYSVGVSRAFGPINVGFTYVNTNQGLEGFFGATNDNRVFFTMSTTFNY